MKRILATSLWFYASWTAANIVTYAFGWSGAWGPIVAVTSALVVGLDPRHWIWSNPVDRSVATPVAAPSNQEPAPA